MKLAIIPVKGSDQRISLKNIEEFCGRDIPVRSIELEKKSEFLDKIIINTSDLRIA